MRPIINQLRRWGGSWPGMLVGLALATMAVAWIAHQAALPEAAILDSPLWGLAVLLLAGQYALTAALFLLVTRRYRLDVPLSYWRMLCLTAASTLLNYVPIIRAGLWGRAVFLRHHHGLAYRESLYGLGWILGLSLWSTLLVLLAAATAHGLGAQHAGTGLLVLAILTLLTCAGTPWLLHRMTGRSQYHAWAWPLLRMLELIAATMRLWLILYLLGIPCNLLEVMVAVSVASLVRLTGLTPNGLGLSDWTLALVLSLIDPATLAQTATAALLDRMLEMLFSLPTGLGAMGILGWLHRKAPISPPSDPGPRRVPPHPRDP